MNAKHNKKMRRIIMVASFILGVMIVVLVTFSLTRHPKKDLVVHSETVCSRVYEHDFFQFTHPCDVRVFLATDGKGIKMVKTSEEGTSEQSFFVQPLTESELTERFERYGGSFSGCESGDRFSRMKMTVPSLNGLSHEACLQSEHSGKTLFIHLNQPHAEYFVVSVDHDSVEAVLPTLKVKE